MDNDANQNSHFHFTEQKKSQKQHSVIQQLGAQLVRGGAIKAPICNMLDGMIRDLDYLYAKVTLIGSTTAKDITFEKASAASVKKQVLDSLERAEQEANRALIFKMLPLDNKLEVKHEVFRVKRSYDCFAVAKPLLYAGQLLGCISGVKANVGSMNPKLEQNLLSMISNLISQAVVLNKFNAGMAIAPKRTRPSNFDRAGILGNSQQLQSVFETIRQVSVSDTTILLQGEAGIGRSKFAKCFHLNSSRFSRDFVRFNGSVMEEQALEKALFGSFEKELIPGALSRADGGSLYLEGIESLSLKTQSKVLRFIKHKKFESVGSDETLSSDVRLLVSSSEKLDKAVAEGRFLADLYYSIASFPVNIPSLKDRKSDIIPLADFFVEKFALMHAKRIDRISTPAIDMLSSYHWPGNVRELEGCIERAVLLTNEEVIRGHHLPPSLQKISGPAVDAGIDLKRQLESVEKELILDALKNSRGNMAKASRYLGLTERVMGLRVSSHGINVKKFKSQNT